MATSCPKCGFSFGWNGRSCNHCKYVLANADIVITDAVRFNCPECNKRIRAPLTAQGKQSSCPNCKSALTIPNSSDKQVPEVADPFWDIILVGKDETRTRQLGDWKVTEGREALLVGAKAKFFADDESVICATLSHLIRLPNFLQTPVVMRAVVECKSCGNSSEGDCIFSREDNDYLGVFCSYCNRDIGGRFIKNGAKYTGLDTSRLPTSTVLVFFFGGKRLSIIDVFDKSELSKKPPVRIRSVPTTEICAMCKKKLRPVDQPLQDGLCQNCLADSHAAISLVPSSTFVCDACNQSKKKRIGEIFKAPMILGSFFCKACYPSAHGKSWRRESE